MPQSPCGSKTLLSGGRAEWLGINEQLTTLDIGIEVFLLISFYLSIKITVIEGIHLH